MGARGPQPTPTKILEARGSWRAKEREGEVQMPLGVPSCPDWLSDEAKREWRRQVKQLEAAGILAKADRAMLAMYCDAWGQYVEAATKLEEIGLFIKTADGRTILNPLLKVRDRAAGQAIQLAGHFGFSPATRTRIKAPERVPEQPAKLRYFAIPEGERGAS